MTKVRQSSTQEEILELRRRLEEAEETLRAIREGEVDALVVDSPHGEMIYTLTSADYPYRLMIDEMNEGAVSVSPDSFILYSNRNFAGILFPRCVNNLFRTCNKHVNIVFVANTRLAPEMAAKFPCSCRLQNYSRRQTRSALSLPI